MSLSLFSCENNIVPESNEPNIAPSTTSKPKYETPKIDASLWKTAYLNIIECRQELDGTRGAYALVYVDDDNIPELYIKGCCEAEGDIIYSYKNDTVLEQRLSRMLGGKYIERSGKIANKNGHMGNYYTHIYVLSNSGFTQTFNASYTERYEGTGGKGDFAVNIICEYFINGESVNETDYNDAVNASFDFSQSTEFYEKAVSYNEIKQQLS